MIWINGSKSINLHKVRMSAQNSDEAMIASILQSMGIHKHDPLVVTALNEYARRYAGTLLTDAKCYSEYAGRSVIMRLMNR